MSLDKEQRRQLYNQALQLVKDQSRQLTQPYDRDMLGKLTQDIQNLAPLFDLDERWVKTMLHKAQLERPVKPNPPRSHEQWSQIFRPYPTDDQDYAKAFEPGDSELIAKTLEEFGVVVVRVASKETCERVITSMFADVNEMKAEGRVSPVDRHDPSTWIRENWPHRGKFMVRRPALHPGAFILRLDPSIHDIFSELWGDSRLRVSIDNWGMSRGTRGLDIAGEKRDRPDWESFIKPHWDVNPWLFAKEAKVGFQRGFQALVALDDQSVETGCHLTLPGGLPFLETWCKETKHPSSLGFRRRSHRPKEDDPCLAYMQKLPLRQGHMILWSWGQLHGNTPNRSSKMRLHQYLRMFPAAEVDQFYEHHDRYAPRRISQKYRSEFDLKRLDLDARGRRLLGLEKWTSKKH